MNFGFEFPPRPHNAISPDLIDFYEGRGWIAQLKKNGTCSTARVSSDGSVEFWTRHGDKHKAWQPHGDVIQYFSNFPDSYFAFELLHSKGPTVKDTAYVFDVTRYCGRDMYDCQLAERLDTLRRVVPLTSRVILAETYAVGLRALYASLDDPLDEGLVLKNPASKLRPGIRDGLNSTWQVKCRKPTKNYPF
jgi:hypothetical protein